MHRLLKKTSLNYSPYFPRFAPIYLTLSGGGSPYISFTLSPQEYRLCEIIPARNNDGTFKYIMNIVTLIYCIYLIIKTLYSCIAILFTSTLLNKPNFNPAREFVPAAFLPGPRNFRSDDHRQTPACGKLHYQSYLDSASELIYSDHDHRPRRPVCVAIVFFGAKT
jgi:hypothetical protein